MNEETTNLPPELQGELTDKERAKDEAHRDRMIALYQSAARLSPEEERLAHAHLVADNYRLEIDRLNSLLNEKGAKKREIKARLEVTAKQLADALCATGDYDAATEILRTYAKKSSRLKIIAGIQKALALDDDNHCKCHYLHKHVKQRVYDRSRRRFKDLLFCSKCGHQNATATLPDDVKTFHDIRSQAKEGFTDDHIKTQMDRALPAAN